MGLVIVKGMLDLEREMFEWYTTGEIMIPVLD